MHSDAPSSTPMHAVVVGGGVAGTSCAEALLAWSSLEHADSPTPSVTLVSASDTVCLGRALSGTARLREVTVHASSGTDWGARAGVRFVHARATGLDAAGRTVTLSSGDALRYDALCVATGAAPIVPETLRGIGCMHVVRDAGSIDALRRAVRGAKSVLVVGSGGVALETVYALEDVDVVWAFRGETPGRAFFDKTAAEALLAARGLDPSAEGEERPRGPAQKDAIAAAAAADALGSALGAAHGPFWGAEGVLRGVLDRPGKLVLHAGTEVAAVEEGAAGAKVTLTDGSVVHADVIVCGTGVVPVTSWVGSALSLAPCGGIEVPAGVMTTSVPAVFAAGDCTAVRTADAGRDWFQRRLWTQAGLAGACAGRLMAHALVGASDVVDTGMEFELFAHATRFLGVRVAFLGRYRAQGLPEGYKMLEAGRDGAFVRAVVSVGVLRGALLVGEAVERAETFENLILDGLNVDHLGAALVDLDEDIADYFD